MDAKSLEQILSFRGEFPGDLLNHLRSVATVTGPYDECARDPTGPDSLALFELLELQGCFDETFQGHVTAGAEDVLAYVARETEGLKPRDKMRFRRRFNRALVRIMQELQTGYPLTLTILKEMLAHAEISQLQRWVSIGGLALTRQIHLQDGKLVERYTPDAAPQRNDFAWFDFAATMSGFRAPRFAHSDTVREILRGVELVPPVAGVAIRLPRRPDLGGRYGVFFAASSNPLSLGRIAIRDDQAGKLLAIAELSRMHGHLMFEDCTFLSLVQIFHELGAQSTYVHLCDLAAHGVYSLLTQGQLVERSYITEPSPLVTEHRVESFEGAESAGAVQVASAGVEQTSPPGSSDLAGESSAYVPRGRLSYRNIMGALFRFGVTIESGGRHVKLRFGNATSPFLNRHAHENPAHNRAVLREALKRLGIDEREFMASLM